MYLKRKTHLGNVQNHDAYVFFVLCEAIGIGLFVPNNPIMSISEVPHGSYPLWPWLMKPCSIHGDRKRANVNLPVQSMKCNSVCLQVTEITLALLVNIFACFCKICCRCHKCLCCAPLTLETSLKCNALHGFCIVMHL